MCKHYCCLLKTPGLHFTVMASSGAELKDEMKELKQQIIDTLTLAPTTNL